MGETINTYLGLPLPIQKFFLWREQFTNVEFQGACGFECFLFRSRVLIFKSDTSLNFILTKSGLNTSCNILISPSWGDFWET